MLRNDRIVERFLLNFENKKSKKSLHVNNVKYQKYLYQHTINWSTHNLSILLGFEGICWIQNH